MDLADTLNALTACFYRAMRNGDLTSAAVWKDSIFALNSNSIVGYGLEKAYQAAQGDSVSAVEACDSLLAIAERYGDPALPDSASMNVHERAWYEDKISFTKLSRWEQSTGNRVGFR